MNLIIIIYTTALNKFTLKIAIQKAAYIMVQTKKAFTLPEILLILAIIGVIAALTIPGIVHKLSSKETVLKLKKEYSVIISAYSRLSSEHDGDIAGSGIFEGEEIGDSSEKALNAFTSKMNLLKNCGSKSGCWYNSPLKALNGTALVPNIDDDTNNYSAKAILSDSTFFILRDQNGNCETTFGSGPLDSSGCAIIGIDINGNIGPNTAGRDYFEFFITKVGVIPRGAYESSPDCGVDTNIGLGCTERVLTDNEINY